MPENSINMQDNNNRCCGGCGCNNGGFLNGLFGGNDSEILFLLLQNSILSKTTASNSLSS